MARPRKKSSAIVPKLVRSTIAVGVIPACALGVGGANLGCASTPPPVVAQMVPPVVAQMVPPVVAATVPDHPPPPPPVVAAMMPPVVAAMMPPEKHIAVDPDAGADAAVKPTGPKNKKK